MQATKTNRRGFTLVDLLVVIIIIAFLVALLICNFPREKEGARRAQCASNQRQIAFALQNYEQTNRGFPPLRGPLNPATYWRDADNPPPRHHVNLGVIYFAVHGTKHGLGAN